jgi:predicted RNA binding protein YcfA (HicA-like mRNA interferase family)
VSQLGSYLEFARQFNLDVDTVIMPKKHEIPVGTLRSILNQGHLEIEDRDRL